MTTPLFLQLKQKLPPLDRFLDLPEFKVLEVEHTPDALRICVEKRHKGEFCPSCGRFANDHHSYRSRERAIQDIPYGKPTYLIIRTERFDCGCGERGITETYESVASGAHKTKRFEEYLIADNHGSTFMRCARENNLSVASVYGRFMGFAGRALSSLAKRAPEIRFPAIMNMDDVSRRKGHKYMTVLANNTQKNSST